MKNYLKLLNFEINRFSKLYFLMLAIIFSVQLISVFYHIFSYLAFVKMETKGGRMTPEQFLAEHFPFGWSNVFYTRGFLIPILIGVVGLILYVFFIWYRDWMARNTFIYRLLMLPTSRMNIFYAKLSAIMLFVLTTVGIQLIFLVLYKKIIEWFIPVVYRDDLSITMAVVTSPYLNTIVPAHLSSFFVAYGLGLAAVIVVFTAILFERSFQLVGILYGLLYAVFSFVLFSLPLVVQLLMFETLYLYADEMFILMTAIVIGIIVVSLLTSRYLLNHKVSV